MDKSQQSKRMALFLSLVIIGFGGYGLIKDVAALVKSEVPLSWFAAALAGVLVLTGSGIYVYTRYPGTRLRKIHEWTGYGLLALLLAAYSMVPRASLDAHRVSFMIDLLFVAVGGLIYFRFKNQQAQSHSPSE